MITNEFLIRYGLCIMVAAVLALAGVLHALYAALVAGYHDALWVDPLTAPRSLVERHHLRTRCADCTMIAELVVTRLMG